MLNAILDGKSGRLSREAERNIRWRDLFRDSEDLVTSTVFERLAYLPAAAAWQILAAAAGGQLHPYRMAELVTLDFWPMWETEGRVRGVEPDVFIELMLGDPARRTHVIVEAKHDSAQLPGQIQAEIGAWLEAVSAGTLELPDHLIFITVGGHGLKYHKAQLEDAFGKATAALVEKIHELSFVMLDWGDIARAVSLHAAGSPQEERIRLDLERAMELYGYHHLVATWHLESLLAHRPVDRGLAARLLDLNRNPTKRQKA